MNYWQFGDYLAAGAGAHGKLSDSDGRVVRYRKPANPVTFMEQAGKAEAPAAAIEVGPDDLAFEFMLNALRLPGGFSADLYRERTGLDIGGLTPQIGQAVADGLLEEFEARAWRPTSTGFRFLNDLQARFLPAGTP
jgi:oxygen-independent coproporphyrinogen-3 oxidase